MSIEREDIVSAHKASPLVLSSKHERELKDLVRAHSTPQNWRNGPGSSSLGHRETKFAQRLRASLARRATGASRPP
jgi:hypothetical protein